MRQGRSAGPGRTEIAARDASELASYTLESWRSGVPLPSSKHEGRSLNRNRSIQPRPTRPRGDHARLPSPLRGGRTRLKAEPGGGVIPTRVKADSFRGFQTGASQILWGEQEVRHAARDCTSSGLRRGPALGLSESDPGCGSKSAVAGAGRDL